MVVIFAEDKVTAKPAIKIISCAVLTGPHCEKLNKTSPIS